MSDVDLVINGHPDARHGIVHIASGFGSLCGRLPEGRARRAPSGSQATCRWCLSKQAEAGRSSHRAKMVCVECGQDWPCSEAATCELCRRPVSRYSESGDRCYQHRLTGSGLSVGLRSPARNLDLSVPPLGLEPRLDRF